MGKKGFHRNGDVIEDDILGGVRVINGRVQCTAVVPTSPNIGPGPIKIEKGVASKGEAELTSAGALKMVQG